MLNPVSVHNELNLESLVAVFDRSVGHACNTRLQGGAHEPLYTPGELNGGQSVIYFRSDYLSSALHEVSHWCIAGPERRRREDYGYWYKGHRGAPEQRDFEAVEARPQALEWIMSNAAGIPFRVSCDNFDDQALDMTGFRQMVRREVPGFLKRMPPRAASFIDGLIEVTGRADALNCRLYTELPD